MSSKISPYLDQARLANTDKILFVAHLALGDFTYLQPYFKAFSEAYPHIKIDLWVDEVRRTRSLWRWDLPNRLQDYFGHYDHLKGYILYDWLDASPFFNHVYNETYLWSLYKQCHRRARAENYPVVVSLAHVRTRRYAALARSIAPNGYVIGTESKRGHEYRDLDDTLDYRMKNRTGQWHVSDLYAHWFQTMFGLSLEDEKRKPHIAIPKQWMGYGATQCEQWDIDRNRYPRTFFINAFAKDEKRSWDVHKLEQLIERLCRDVRFDDACFVVNAPPVNYDAVKHLERMFAGRVFLLLASDNFFQLPSMLALCDLVISVETSVMHFAAALSKPLIPLMRLKNPEWAPLGVDHADVVFVKERTDVIPSIPVDAVLDRVYDFEQNRSKI